MTELSIVRNEDEHRYEARSGERVAGVAEYRERGDRTVFTHTEVGSGFEGRGVGTALAAAALKETVERGRVIVPLCPFIASYVRRHPEFEGHVRWPEGPA